MTNVFDILTERGYIEQSTDNSIRDLWAMKALLSISVLTRLRTVCTLAISFRLW